MHPQGQAWTARASRSWQQGSPRRLTVRERCVPWGSSARGVLLRPESPRSLLLDDMPNAGETLGPKPTLPALSSSARQSDKSQSSQLEGVHLLHQLLCSCEDGTHLLGAQQPNHSANRSAEHPSPAIESVAELERSGALTDTLDTPANKRLARNYKSKSLDLEDIRRRPQKMPIGAVPERGFKSLGMEDIRSSASQTQAWPALDVASQLNNGSARSTSAKNQKSIELKLPNRSQAPLPCPLATMKEAKKRRQKGMEARRRDQKLHKLDAEQTKIRRPKVPASRREPSLEPVFWTPDAEQQRRNGY
eukprot:COSAG02_NODE_354_length_24016_cov_208.299231_21_plen_305_part_00